MYKIKRIIFITTLIVSLVIIFAVQSFTQQLPLPRLSPNASVTQTIGITDVTIKYSRPGVKGRTIWGELVPYDKMWRTGANDATQLSSNDTLIINEVKIAPGTYSIATIPGKEEWTVIINKNQNFVVGSNYKQEEDVLRIKVKPTTGEFVERMRITFEDFTDNSAMVVLAWEKLRIAFKIEVDLHAQVLRKVKSAINWSTPNSAANYFLQQNTDLDLAMKWVDVSLSIQENYWNLRVKSQLLAKAGKKSEAITTMEKAIKLGKDMKEPPFDFSQMQKLVEEWKKN